MNIQCANCKYEFILPDERVPDASKFKLNCPKCREPILIERPAETAPMAAPENFPHDAQVAFVYVESVTLQNRINNFLKSKGFYVSEGRNVAESLEKLRINYYNLLILEDSINAKLFQDLFKKWTGLRRRDVNVVFVNADCQSLHSGEAFYRGVNSVISKSDVESIEHLLEQAMSNYSGYLEPWSVAASRIQ